MLCKKTVKNQITLPKKLMDDFNGVEYFNVIAQFGKIVLVPVKMKPLGKKALSLSSIQKKISSLRLTEDDIDKAIQWARKK